MTKKKAKNPKDEVSSSKIDEMAKDLKIVAKVALISLRVV